MPAKLAGSNLGISCILEIPLIDGI
jgi:hypothetical protein